MTMSRQDYTTAWSALHGGYTPRPGGIVSRYLGLMYVIARPFVRLRVAPNAVTLGALLITVSAPVLLWRFENVVSLLAAAAIIAITGLLDGVDGAVAVMRQKVSAWGAVLDSVADRVSEVIYLATLVILGAPLWLVAVAGTTSLLAEYLRARAGYAGMRDIGVVTVFERPTRIALTAMTCVGLASLRALDSDLNLATITSAVWFALSMVALLQLAAVMRRALAS